MTETELTEKMLAFIETQDGDCFEEWYETQKGFAEVVLTDFAKYLGVNLIVPEYVPRKTKPEIDRAAILEALLPEVRKMLNAECDRRMKEQS